MRFYFSGHDYNSTESTLRRQRKLTEANRLKWWQHDLAALDGIADSYLMSAHYAYTVRIITHLLRRSKAVHGRPTRLMIDSGAFSAWNSGLGVDLEKLGDLYCSLNDWLVGRVDEWYFVNLDSIPGKPGQRPTRSQLEESGRVGWSNMEYLQSRGLPVIHIFHQHEPWDLLSRIAGNSPYIGLSPANDLGEPSRVAWARDCFEHLDKLGPMVRCHGFATTGGKMIRAGPWYSVDSASWKSPLIYGRVQKAARTVTEGLQTRDADHIRWAARRNVELHYMPRVKRETQGWARRGYDWEKRDDTEDFWQEWNRTCGGAKA